MIRPVLVIATIAMLSAPLATELLAERRVFGRVVDANGNAVAGYRVRAMDEDPIPGEEDDEQMHETTTNASGDYSMTYRKGTWDGLKIGTAWRPDIYLLVAKPKPGGGWIRVYKSGVRDDWAVRNDIELNISLPADGECPFPGKFQTTGTFRGCSCPSGTYKRRLDVFNYEARCARGSSPEAQCKVQGGIWIGVNNTKGVCAREPDVPSAHRWIAREAYRKYMRDVAVDVRLQPLPRWVINRYQVYYKAVDLRNVRIGESDHTPSDSTAITDCQKIYFPTAAAVVREINTQASGLNYHWMLHEIAHSNQCMGLDGGTFSTKRDKYADMWFGNLPEAILVSILTDGAPIDGAIHDHMAMEHDADNQASAIITATGIGAIPASISCPPGEFSTRDFRGCVCANGAKKVYQGIFDQTAVCR